MTNIEYTKFLVGVVLKDKNLFHKYLLNDFDFDKLLVKASTNRILLVFCKNLLDLNLVDNKKKEYKIKKIVQSGEKAINGFRKTINFLNSSLGKEKIPFLIVKTFKYLDYVTFDVDFLVPYDKFHKSIKVLKKYGAKVDPHPRKQGLHQRNCFVKGLLKMDLHRKFFWQGIEHIDLDYVWANPEKRIINGVECLCPSLEVDFLLHNKQLVYERYYTTILDFLAVKYAVEKGNLNFKNIIQQVNMFKWNNSYKSLLYYLNSINLSIFEKKMFSNKSAKRYENLCMPFIYPYKEIIYQLFEIIFRQKAIPFFDFSYYHFTFLRFYLSGKKLFPYYRHWFNFPSIGLDESWDKRLLNEHI